MLVGSASRIHARAELKFENAKQTKKNMVGGYPSFGNRDDWVDSERARRFGGSCVACNQSQQQLFSTGTQREPRPRILNHVTASGLIRSTIGSS